MSSFAQLAMRRRTCVNVAIGTIPMDARCRLPAFGSRVQIEYVFRLANSGSSSLWFPSDFSPSKRSGCYSFVFLSATSNCTSSYPLAFKDSQLLSERLVIPWDIFPDALPFALPPKRPVEDKFDLVPSSEPVKRPIYKLSTEELNKVNEQGNDLLMKGFIRPNTSSWSSSIIFVTKKGGDAFALTTTL
jgi:hypothetical protein